MVLSKEEKKCFSFAYNSAFSKIYNTFDNNVIMCCQYYSNFLTFELLYDYHRYSFLLNLVRRNEISHKSELDRLEYNDFLKLKLRYKFNESDSTTQLKNKVWLAMSELVYKCNV